MLFSSRWHIIMVLSEVIGVYMMPAMRGPPGKVGSQEAGVQNKSE